MSTTAFTRRLPRTIGLAVTVCILALVAVTYRQHSQVSGAPNGRVVYFGLDTNNDAQIYAINADGTSKQQLTNDTLENFNPSVSPDGRKIAFVADPFVDGNYQIYVMNADGTAKVALTNDDNTVNTQPSWSPDGNKIVFQRQPSDFSTPSQIFTMNADGTGVTQVTNDAHSDSNPSWHPGGTKLIFTCGNGSTNQLCTINADGTNRTALTNDSNYYDFATYSPDGSQIAFTRGREVFIRPTKGS